MCQYTYHHYRDCGHISSFTMDSCVEIFNSLRLTASADTSLSCSNIRTKHDQLPVDYKTQCLQCELDWSRHVATYGIPLIAHCNKPCILIEGTDYSAPIVVTRMEMHLNKPAMAMCSEFDRAYFKEELESGELTCDKPQVVHVSQGDGCEYGPVMQTPRLGHEVISICLDTSCSDDSVEDSDLCEDYEVVENTDQTASNNQGFDMDDFDSDSDFF